MDVGSRVTTAHRKPYVVGNWKMVGDKASIQLLVDDLISQARRASLDFNKVEVVLCPPFPYLNEVSRLIEKTGFKLGAQNVYYETKGAYTGEVSPTMLVDLGCQYVIIGHSERRQLFSETNHTIARKVQAAYDVGLCPIVCVGETEQERETQKTQEVLKSQFEAVLSQTGPAVFKKALLAYEPVWAIGSGKTPSPNEIAEVHAFLRSLAPSETLCILYGGSVKASNSEALFSEPEIDGVLVGGAAWQAEDFLKICESGVCNKSSY